MNRDDVFAVIVSYKGLAKIRNVVDALRGQVGRIRIEALKPGGTLLLSLPNAASLVRSHFGDIWRGLEALKHLSIPSMCQLEANLREIGFTVRQRQINRLWTAAGSSRIQRRGTRINAHDKAVAKTLTANAMLSSDQEHDFVQFICVRGTSRVL